MEINRQRPKATTSASRKRLLIPKRKENIYKQKRCAVEAERFSLIKGINIKLSKKMFRNKISLISLKLISVLKISPRLCSAGDLGTDFSLLVVFYFRSNSKAG